MANDLFGGLFGNGGAGYRNNRQLGNVIGDVLGIGDKRDPQQQQRYRESINDVVRSDSNQDLLAEINRQSKNPNDTLTGPEMSNFLAKLDRDNLQQTFRFENGPLPGTYVAYYGNYQQGSQPMRISMDAIQRAVQSGQIEWQGDVQNHPEMVALRNAKPAELNSALDSDTLKPDAATGEKKLAEAGLVAAQQDKTAPGVESAAAKLELASKISGRQIVDEREANSIILNGSGPTMTTAATKEASVIAEPVKAEPAKVDPVTAEPVKVEPAKVDPVTAEPVKVEPAKVDPVTAEPVKVEPAKDAPPVVFAPVGDRTLVNAVSNEISAAAKVRTVNDDAKAIEAFLKANPVIGADGKPIVDTRPGFKDDGILSEVEATAALNRAEYLRTKPDGKGTEALTSLQTALNQATEVTKTLTDNGVIAQQKVDTPAAKEKEPSQLDLPPPSITPVKLAAVDAGELARL